MLDSGIKKVRFYWEAYGFIGCLKRTLRRMLCFFFAYRPLDFYGIFGLPSNQIETKCSLDIRKGTIKDVPLVEEINSHIIDKTAFRKWISHAIDQKSEMFLAFSDGRLAHVSWLHHHHEIQENDFLVRIDSSESYIGSCHTAAQFRGQNIYPAVLQHIVEYVVESGKNRCFICAYNKNRASIKGIEKAGFSFVEKKRTFKLLGRVFNNIWISDTIRSGHHLESVFEGS